MTQKIPSYDTPPSDILMEYKSSDRLASLDLIRGIAAFMVAIPHFFMSLGDHASIYEGVSSVSVEIFFTLSGFVLAPQLIRCIQFKSSENIIIFYARRWIRTIPPYVFALILVSIPYKAIASNDFIQYLLFIRSFFNINDSNDYFFLSWSIAIEEWFYLLFPIFFYALPFRTLKQGVIGFLLLFFILKIIALSYNLVQIDHIRRITLLRLDSIAFGFSTYIWLSKNSLPLRLVISSITISFSIMILSMLAIDQGHEAIAVVIYIYSAQCFGSLLVLVGYNFRSKIGSSTFLSDASLYLGKISYSVYLFHLPIAIIINKNMTSNMSIRFLVYVLTIFTFTSAFHYIIEQPLLSSRPQYKSLGLKNAHL